MGLQERKLIKIFLNLINLKYKKLSCNVLIFSGTLNIDGGSVNLIGGRAYVEKDWGSKFPKTWVWIQANHFAAENGAMGTLMLSVASIPFPSDQVPL